MRKIICIIPFFIAACSLLPDYAEFYSADRQYVFTIADVDSLAPVCLEVKQDKHGRDYTFVRSESKLNGYSSNCGQRFDCDGREVEYYVQISIQTSIDRARQLFKSQTSSRPTFGKSRVELRPEDYSADEVYLASGDSSFFISVRRGLINYSITINGFSLRESDVRPHLLEKLAYLDHNPRPGLGEGR